MQTYTRRSYHWSIYYTIIRGTNKAINMVENVAIPPLKFKADTLSNAQYMLGVYYAQAHALRGWAYSELCRYFIEMGETGSVLAFPIYTELDTKVDSILGHERATAADVYLRIEEDLTTAIQYFKAYDEYERDNKIEMNIDIARITLAYSYLNKGDYTNAYKYATEAIDNMRYTLLPKNEVLTTGFNNIASNNWIWGKDVTVENTTSLASFFGQCDIYSYSYAAAGDIKGIDMNLYDSIQVWDIRKNWWNNYYNKLKDKDSKTADRYRFAPDGKFYSAKSKELMGDRDWLSDDVYMRAEVAYLIAAEAAARNNDFTNARKYLHDITDLRVADGQETAYATWKSSLADADLLAAIKENWRIEMWGEGYGLQTFRRYGEGVKLGENHRRSKKDIDPSTSRVFTFELPTSEMYYNPAIREEDSSEAKNMKRKI
jgi:tetratricopeptide (TPR) repeat protein